QLLSEQRGVVQQAVYDALAASTEDDEAEDVARKAVSELAIKLKQRPEWEKLPDAAILTEWLMPDADSLPTREFKDAPATHARTPVRGHAAEPADDAD